MPVTDSLSFEAVRCAGVDGDGIVAPEGRVRSCTSSCCTLGGLRKAGAAIARRPPSFRQRFQHLAGLPHPAQPREDEVQRCTVLLRRGATHGVFDQHQQ